MWGPVNTLRQTHYCSGIAGISNYVSEDPENCDFAIIGMNEKFDKKLESIFPREKRVMIIMENPSIWKVKNEILNQAGIVISPFQNDYHINMRWIRSQPGIPWFYGINFDINSNLEHKPLSSNSELSALASKKRSHKTKLLSVIMSGKAGLPGYEWRKSLANQLQLIMGRDCEIFGFGHKPVADKAEAIDDFLFSLAIENEDSDYYWTEKLADPLLGFSIPIYSGARKVQEDFPSEILTIPYFMDINKACKQIIRYISTYSPQMNAGMEQNRSAILYKHNFFYMVPSKLSAI